MPATFNPLRTASCRPASLFINEHHFGKHFGCERDRLALSPIELRQMRLLLGLRTSTHLGAFPAQSRTGFGEGVFQLCQHGRWNQNSGR